MTSCVGALGPGHLLTVLHLEVEIMECASWRPRTRLCWAGRKTSKVEADVSHTYQLCVCNRQPGATLCFSLAGQRNNKKGNNKKRALVNHEAACCQCRKLPPQNTRPRPTLCDRLRWRNGAAWSAKNDHMKNYRAPAGPLPACKGPALERPSRSGRPSGPAPRLKARA